MIICKTALALQNQLVSDQDFALTRGFVPTMGALHAGHLSLIREAKKKCKIVIASIFVNPTQFNDPGDFAKYPITIAADILMLEKEGCDILLLPSVEEMYPNGTQHLEHYDIGRMDQLLEGAYRPGHFQGVCQVVYRLLQMVKPGQLFMGAKDYQQCMVVNRLLEIKSLPVIFHKCPTLREQDGLAMSSRNRRLNEIARSQATAIYRELQKIHQHKNQASPRKLEEEAKQNLLDAGFEAVDYISIAHPETLEPLEKIDEETAIVVCCAAYIDGTRLIDNLATSDIEAKSRN